MQYRTIRAAASAEFVEKRSRFIGYISPVTTQQDAIAFIDSIKSKHWDATHNVPAYIIREGNICRFSDDGEPGGTAGKPILEVIKGNELCDVCIVVTRYFGGTLLGTGGLVRAYTDAAKACIENTQVLAKRRMIPMKLHTNYTDFGKIQYLLASEEIPIIDSEYGEDVCVHVEIFVDDADEVKKKLIEVTAARIIIDEEDAVCALRRQIGIHRPHSAERYVFVQLVGIERRTQR